MREVIAIGTAGVGTGSTPPYPVPVGRRVGSLGAFTPAITMNNGTIERAESRRCRPRMDRIMSHTPPVGPTPLTLRFADNIVNEETA